MNTLLFSAALIVAGADHAVDPSTLVGKLMVGYQGWHTTVHDGAGLGWTHWSNDGSDVPGPATVHVDAFPDLAEYPAAALEGVNFTWANGSQVALYSAQYPAVTRLHFSWMQSYDVDGAFVQRFLQGITQADILAGRDRVASNSRVAAEATGRVFAIEYDVSGVADADIMPTLSADWTHVTASASSGEACPALGSQ
jgi:hypothetical protein